VVKTMSDPAKNSEIEDVLSSIRRLVSEEARPAMAPRTPAKPDRLVLTPALRVADTLQTEEAQERARQGESVAVEEVPEQAAVEDHADALQAEQSYDHRDQQEEDHGEADDHAQDDVAHDHDGDPAADMAEGESVLELTGALEPDAGKDEPAEEAAEAAQHGEPHYENPQLDEATEQPTEQPAEAAAEPEQTWNVVDSFDFDAMRDAPLQDFEHEQDVHAAAAPDELDEQDEQGAPTDAVAVAAMAEAAVSSALMDRIARMEAVVADQDGEWEPDGDGPEANAAAPTEVLAWEDHVEGTDDGMDAGQDTPEAQFRHAEPEPYADPAPVAERPEEDTAVEDAILDEEALREMVADIVRQELQGALGERITRNVRKLVRREIHRALASHELD